MAGVYVFNYDDVDFDTTGLVGDLQPVECSFYEEKNGESNLSMRLCYDPLNKWAAVKVGSYIKAKVPVRVPPKITSNAYDKQIMTWKVKSSIERHATIWQSSGVIGNGTVVSTKPEKCDFFYNCVRDDGEVYFRKQVPVTYRLKAGSEVQVLEQKSDGRVKVYGQGFGTGWTIESNLEQVVATTIPATFDGVESAVTPTRLQYQLFQVTSVEQTLDGVSVTAQHVFYELLHSFTSYKADAPTEAFNAINGVFDGMVTVDERFTCLTDASHKAGALDYERVNMVQALLDPENGICAQYGLSLLRDNYDLYALKCVGSDRGFVVEYGKNMLSVERIEDISNVVTRIIPFGKDAKGNLVFMDNCIYVDSAHIDEYAFPRTMYLDCSDTATETENKMTLSHVKAELKKRAEAEFAAGCDLPELTMTVDFISLGDTEEYKQYRDLDKVYLFDKITVKDKVRGYDYNAEVVAITHNVLTGQLESVTLGSIQKGTGIRKIATWQVPEVDGANIRLQSIAAGVLAGGAVGEDNLQDNSVGTRAIVAQSVTTEKLAAGSVTADKIAAGAISADFIEAGSITADKMAAGVLSADLIGAGEITTDKLAAGAVTAEKLAAGAISSDFIEAGSITADKLAAGVLSADLIGAGSITTDKLAAGAVTTAKLAAGAVTANKIDAKAITTDKIATGAITAESGIIANSAIGTTQIADGSITSAKIVSLNADVITSGTLSTERLLIKGTDGIIYEINAQSSGLTAAELTEEQYKNQINGTVIVAQSITADQLAANAVTANKILSGAITTDKLDANAVTANKIAAGAITTSKLASDVGSSLDISSNKAITMIVSDVDDLSGTVAGHTTSITQNANAIALKAEKSVVDALNTTVSSHTTSIKQNADSIALKAEKSTVDNLSKTVSSHATSITANAEAIKLKASQTDVDALPTTYMQFTQPTGTFNVGDVWIKTVRNKAWTDLNDRTWTAVKEKQWGEWALSDEAVTYVWTGTKWLLTVDYNAVKKNETSITQTAKEISLKASAETVSNLAGRVATNSTEIKQNANAIMLKATEADPATYVKTSTVTVSADGVEIETGGTIDMKAGSSIAMKSGAAMTLEGASMSIKSGGTLDISADGALTVDAENFSLSSKGQLEAISASLTNATISGDVSIVKNGKGYSTLSEYDIYVGTNAPKNPHNGMIWIQPDSSTSAQTTFSAPVPWKDRGNMVQSSGNTKTGTLTGSKTAAVGNTYTYRAKVPVHLREYSSGTTGAYVYFAIATSSGGSAVLTAQKAVTITDYGSGDKIIEFEFTDADWVGNYDTLYFSLYTTGMTGYYQYNVLNSSNTGLSITLECTSKSSSGATGWVDCTVHQYKA